jgi:soluble lytic murein transglycosylase
MLSPARLILCLSFIALSLAAPLQAETLAQQRALFIEAEEALERGDDAGFARLRARLDDYPLAPYLDYAILEKRLPGAMSDDVRAFLERHDGSVVADRLRHRWLTRLADQRRWQTFLAFYEPTSSVTLQCHRLHALIETGQRDAALAQVEAIWLHGESRPKACDPVFAAWEQAGQRTAERNWRRIALAMEEGETGLARYLARPLPESDRAWVERWIGLYRNPRRVDDELRGSGTHPYREAMVAQAIRRLAIWNGPEAMGRWQRLRDTLDFSPEQRARTEHYIVRNLERDPEPEVYDFVRRVDMTGGDEEAFAARVRAALLREDWPRVAEWIAEMPSETRGEERWQYWRARALEGMGRTEDAAVVYREVANDRSYYGFLAADRIGEDYHLAHTETPVDPELARKIESEPAIARARELFYLERWTDARREWREATREMPAGELKAAAKIAQRKGWYDRAIFTLARTGYWDDLELRFPLAHRDLVERYAKRHDVEKAWVYAVMRQESAFMANARSHAGALGLMQLMPATARAVALNELKRAAPRRHEIMIPETNIALGSAYLRQMKRELGDSEVLATAAYNAGPHRVTRWLPGRTLPADIWIELVPFRETRGYLRRVLAYTVIYEKRMGLTPTRLSDRLHPVMPNLDLMTRASRRGTGAG